MIFMQIPELGDCIGCESCLDLKPATEVPDYDYTPPPPPPPAAASGGEVMVSKTIEKEEAAVSVGRKFTPRISSLARTDNQQMTWVMKKYYTGDGRLVIKDEKLKRQEYLHAYRADGRLVMSLVPMEDDDDDGEEEEGESGADDGRDEPIDNCVGNVAVTDTAGEGITGTAADGGNDEGIGDSTAQDVFPEHCKYNRMGGKPCGGGFAAPPPPPPLQI